MQLVMCSELLMTSSPLAEPLPKWFLSFPSFRTSLAVIVLSLNTQRKARTARTVRRR